MQFNFIDCITRLHKMYRQNNKSEHRDIRKMLRRHRAVTVPLRVYIYIYVCVCVCYVCVYIGCV